MKLIAVTGRMGSGKSEVLGFLQKKGYCTLKADELAKSFLLPDSPCFKDLKALFGVEFLTAKEGFCPQSLGEEVFFKKPWKLKKLGSSFASSGAKGADEFCGTKRGRRGIFCFL